MTHFTKMHALGNDFIVINGVTHKHALTSEIITQFSNRNCGIGFDQCLVVEPSSEPGVDYFYRIFNADGSEVGQCLNGARCVARFLQRNLGDKSQFTIATQTTRMKLYVNSDDTVTVELPPPNFFGTRHIELDESYDLEYLDIGNPHAVLFSPLVESLNVGKIGKEISKHYAFQNGCNVEFVNIISAHHLRARVYERGVGETLACGSGAVAAGAVAIKYHGLDDTLRVTLPGGDLFVQWPQRQGNIFLTGSANFVYEGDIRY